jgi:hypothetical protein
MRNRMAPTRLINPTMITANETKPIDAKGAVGTPPPEIVEEMLLIKAKKVMPYKINVAIGAITAIMLEVMPNFLPVSSDIYKPSINIIAI